MEPYFRIVSNIGPYSILSTSVIDQDHRNTWSPVGFILKVPEEDILIARPDDLASPLRLATNTNFQVFESNLDEIIKQTQNFSRLIHKPAQLIYPLDRLLRKTGRRSNDYNEILIHGNLNAPIGVTAIFIKRQELPAGSAIPVNAEALSRSLKIPLIDLESGGHG